MVSLVSLVLHYFNRGTQVWKSFVRCLCFNPRRLTFLVHIFIATACCLLLACCPPDPICCNQVPLKSSCLWEPRQFCPMVPCENSCEEQEMGPFKNAKSLEVADLIDIALRHNPTTQQTWANARAAAYYLGMAESQLYPAVDLQESLNYQNFRFDDETLASAAAMTAAQTAQAAQTQNAQQNAGPGILPTLRQQNIGQPAQNSSGTFGAGLGPGERTFLNSDLVISYLLLDFGGREASIESALQALYVSDWVHNRQIQEVMVSVLQSYYSYSGLVDLLNARQSDLANAKANLEAAQQLFQAGIKTKLDVLQAQSNLINIEVNIVSLQGQVNITLGNLITNLGLPGNTDIHVAKFPENAPLNQISASIDQLIEEAKNHRPDLYAAYANHEQKRADVTVARSAGLPTLSSQVELQSNIYTHNASLNNHILSGSLVLSIPIFNGFFYTDQTRRAQELLRATCADIRARELGVILDVITGYFNFKTAVESLRFNEEYLKYSQEAYDAALLLYREGIGTILDLLAAQQTLANARAQKVQARTQWIIALANVAFATGVLGEDQPCH